MVFSSLEFLYFYLPICFLIYFLIPTRKLALRNAALFVVSLVFYGWSEPIYIFIMLFSTLVDYVCGYNISKYIDSNKKKSRIFLIASIITNLSLLFFFKYFDFFAINLSKIPVFSFIKPLGITLPVGISFYTFQTMSYSLDIYMRKAQIQKNIITFGSYVTMFPQLIAGPIVRYGDVDEALRKRTHSFDKAAEGAKRFICGLAKKVLLANTAGAMYETLAANVFESPNMLAAWFGIIFFAFQIYFDFSGYSDMAIGLGLVMGFRFPENFNYPYVSKCITEFWRRWHITLSTWFREYMYIPLGGNRKGLARTCINLLIVWLLTGLWHGASWNYIIWGLYFALILILEKLFLLKVLSKIPSFFGHVYSLILILIGWFIFISCDLMSPNDYLFAMFNSHLASDIAIYEVLRSCPFIIILIFAATPLPKSIFKRFEHTKFISIATCFVLPAILLICTAYLVDSSYNPFLYFRF